MVSESAKIAIRDFIDNVTIASDSKIEKVCFEIADKINKKIMKAGK